jgi:hypothetical protein
LFNEKKLLRFLLYFLPNKKTTPEIRGEFFYSAGTEPLENSAGPAPICKARRLFEP